MTIPGDAVVRAGARLYLDATGDASVTLPDDGSVPGFAVHVVARAGDRLAVEPLSAGEHHCAGALEGLADLRLRLFADASALLPVLADHYAHAFADGTRVSLSRGVPIVGDDALFARGTDIVVPLDAAQRGTTYAPAQPLPVDGGELALPWMPEHRLTYGGTTLAEDALHRNLGGVVQYAVRERKDHALVTVRGPCVEVTAKESLERMRATTQQLIGELHGGPVQGAGGGDEPGFGLVGGRIGGEQAEPASPSRRATQAVRAGATIWWPDGREAGSVLRTLPLTAAPRDDGQRRCFALPLGAAPTPTVPLCFEAADIVPFAGARGGTPQLEPPRVDADDGLDPALLSAVLASHLGEVRRCYHYSVLRSAQPDPTRQEPATVTFTLDPQGHVLTTRSQGAGGKPLADAELGLCITQAIARWRFPASSKGGGVRVTYAVATQAQ